MKNQKNKFYPTKKPATEMTRDEVRCAISLAILAHPDAPRSFNLYGEFFTAPTSTIAGRTKNLQAWLEGLDEATKNRMCELVARLNELDR